MSNEETDLELVKRVQKGEKGAFDLLVLKYEHKIVNLVMRYVRDPETALAFIQEFVRTPACQPDYLEAVGGEEMIRRIREWEES